MLVFFFFQAEDGIRDIGVTGVQTCALPISRSSVALVYRNVLSPFSALITGPSIESGPMQNNRMAVDSPSARFLLPPLEWRGTACLHLSSISIGVPINPPPGKLPLNRTGDWLWGK